MRDVFWVGRSKKDLSEMSHFIKNSFGYQLARVQMGKTPHDMKMLPQLGRGVCELRESFDANAYRLMYVAFLKKGIYVLDVFMKKSKSGIGLPKPDVQRIQARLKQALLMDEEKQ
ncbi:MAG: type II toxin-antitoxin system RelE/ParE family toxin [Alphaproteobacteria bacterium]|nr:type II toxin-antitoxin system RelE/ParE family toxin [Alphaproteobacteria bacterium]